MSDPFQIVDLEGVPSPALLVWPDRVQANIARMIELVGDPSRLRPHVKTHKMEEVVRLQLASGIDKFKCATIAELEMCLEAGAPDVLLAYPPVGPNQKRLVQLAINYPGSKLSFICDAPEIVEAVAQAAGGVQQELGVFVDFDCGMARTGTSSSEEVVALARMISESSALRFEGLHAYDGHVRALDLSDREEVWNEAMARVQSVRSALEQADLPAPVVVGGGSPTFGFHAARQGWQCSPGTTLFWDRGYGSSYPDLPFEYAAVVLTRVVSKPGENRLCLDLGHKAIASEGPLEKRVALCGLEDAKLIGHSEEHLVVEVPDADQYSLGQEFVGIPNHICPTVALHQEAILIREGRATNERWDVTARNRRLWV